MKWYKAVIESNGAWPPDEDSSHMRRMEVVFSIGDNINNTAEWIADGIRNDLHIRAYSHVTDMREISETQAYMPNDPDPVTYERRPSDINAYEKRYELGPE